VIVYLWLFMTGVVCVLGVLALLNAAFQVYFLEPWRLGRALQSVYVPLYIGKSHL
jgi:hypothetical protein